MCIIDVIVKNFGSICRFVKAVVQVIWERIYKARTKYFKRRQHKRSRETERRHAVILRMEREAQAECYVEEVHND